jgi:hypothetical protein
MAEAGVIASNQQAKGLRGGEWAFFDAYYNTSLSTPPVVIIFWYFYQVTDFH